MPDLPPLTVNPLDHPIVLHMPRRDLSSAWMEHVPFALYLMDLIRPATFVELGTFYGVSYCAFCQAVHELKLDTRCSAVDSWAGDPHTGVYGGDILADLRRHHDPLYAGFSRLIQSTFDEALDSFPGGSIDLLHIDGYHTYEAVRHDFEHWLPKMSGRGVVLFHDTNVHEQDFGVWKFWEELKARYPHFEFYHGHGLGVAAVGKTIPEGLRPLLEASEQEARGLREFFQELGRRITLYTELAEQKITERNLRNDIHALKVREAALTDEKPMVLALENEVRAHKQLLVEARGRAAELEARLNELQNALIFRLLSRYRRLVDRLMPGGSPARRVYMFAVGSLRFLGTRGPGELMQTFRQTAAIWRRGGFRLFLHMARQKFNAGSPAGSPGPGRHTAAGPSDPKRSLELLSARPLVSIVMPVYNPPVRHLRAAVSSVVRQSYSNWELCICDDGSSNPSIRQELKEQLGDDRIKVELAERNQGIAMATNRAAALASGEWIALMDHDDELTEEALLQVVREINAHPDLQAVYSDQDKIDELGRFSEPFFKPDWSPEYFRSVMYVGHLLVVRKDLYDRLGGMDPRFDGVQDYEFMLRVSEHTDRIRHIARILYHWRKIPGSVAMGLDEKGDKIEMLQAQAVNAHLQRLGLGAVAERHPVHRHRVLIQPGPMQDHPLISIIIPTRDAPEHVNRCLDSIYERTTYPNFEVVVVDNQSTHPAALQAFARHPVTVVPYGQRFNFSQANNLGVQRARGEVLVFLNNDTEVLTPDWLERMMYYLNTPGVAAVGPLLVYPNRTVQHAGVVLGLRGTADHIMRDFPHEADGYAGSLSCTREVAAVTGACLMIRRDLFLEAGGFSEYYAAHYQDVDLCLNLLSLHRRILYVAQATLVHHEGSTRGSAYDHLDRALLLDTWGEFIERGDPYYNPNFSLDQSNYLPKRG